MDNKTYRFKVGTFDCVAVSDVTDYRSAFGAAFFLSGVPEEQRTPVLQAHNVPPENTPMEMNFLFIDTGENKVLVDTGTGPGYRPDSGLLRQRLEALAIEFADIDTVILTHTHHDHIGGVIDHPGDLAFPNARVILSKNEWAFCTSNTESRFPSQLPPEAVELMLEFVDKRLERVRERLDLIEEGAEIVPGIRTIAAPGHSPGHIALSISSNGERLLFLADTLHYALQMEHPDWSVVFDAEPKQAATTRREMLERAANGQALVMGCHLPPFPGLGRVIQRGEAWQWQPIQAAET